MDRDVFISLGSIPSREMTGSEDRCEFHFRRSCQTVLEKVFHFLHHPSNILKHSTSRTLPTFGIVNNVIVIIVIIIIVLAVLVGVKSISLWF